MPRKKKREPMFMQLSRTREVPLRLHKSALPLWLLKPKPSKETDISNHLRSLQTVGTDEYPCCLESPFMYLVTSSPGRTPTVDSPAIEREAVWWVSRSCSCSPISRAQAHSNEMLNTILRITDTGGLLQSAATISPQSQRSLSPAKSQPRQPTTENSTFLATLFSYQDHFTT